MADLTTAQKAEIDAYLHEQSRRDGLAPKQKWEVAKIVSSVIVGFAAILGLGGAFIVSESADKAARSWVISDLATKVTNDASFLERINQSTPIPSGIVAAFDIEQGCPIGWAPFEMAYGRFIVGAGGKEDGPVARSFRETGGEERHILTIDEIPSHTHQGFSGDETGPRHLVNKNEPLPNDQYVAGVRGQAGEGSGRSINVSLNSKHSHPIQVSATGGNQPHNNMPPYVALYFCKHDGTS